MSHKVVEKNTGIMIALIVVAISFAGLVQILPLFTMEKVTTPYVNPKTGEKLKPYSALALEGRDVYRREGCYNCHSQMIRPFRAETERYGPFSVAGESVYDHPFQWGSKRTGPDLARVGGRYSDDWHINHMIDPRSVVPESNMPAYPYLEKNILDGELTARKMETMNMLFATTCTGCEMYSEDEIAKAKDTVAGKTELEALVAYLQGLGTLRQR